MKYRSTRTDSACGYTAAHVIKQGLADDGGLFVPETIPAVTTAELATLAAKSYPERAAYIIGKFLTDYTEGELLSAAKAAYAEPKFPNETAPLAKLGDDGTYVLELWHGPTSAFKDMALQIMPRLLSLALDKEGEKRDALILVATSGDTGKAALEGYADVDRVKIHVFYPVDGVSEVQKRQMSTTEGKNVNVTAVKGNFDDCQNGVKAIFADKDIASKLDKKGYFLSSANSINWGRLVPQVAYYVSAYCDLLREGAVEPGDTVNVTVPTGNFGNILACYIAKKMGLPFGKLICASNKNRVLTDFFETGVYDRRREFYATTSPSMDILISSNLERLLFMVAGAQKTALYMQKLKTEGRFEVEPEIMNVIRKDFCGMSADEADCEKTIASVFNEYGYLCDTHTAVALGCAKEYKNKDKTAMLVASTASPYKFASSVLKALGETEANGFVAQRKLSELTKTEIPSRIADLESRKVRFKDVITPAEMPEIILAD